MLLSLEQVLKMIKDPEGEQSGSWEEMQQQLPNRMANWQFGLPPDTIIPCDDRKLRLIFRLLEMMGENAPNEQVRISISVQKDNGILFTAIVNEEPPVSHPDIWEGIFQFVLSGDSATVQIRSRQLEILFEAAATQTTAKPRFIDS